jgi:hypothetical protein
LSRPSSLEELVTCPPGPPEGKQNKNKANPGTGLGYNPAPTLLPTAASRGEARRGEARRGEARKGEARRGEARRGEARRGEERRAEDPLECPISQRQQGNFKIHPPSCCSFHPIER